MATFLRSVVFVCDLLIVIGLMASFVIVYEAMGPEPGDRMVLMGLPLVVVPMLVLSLIACVTMLFSPECFSPKVRQTSAALGVVSLLLFGTLFLLG